MESDEEQDEFSPEELFEENASDLNESKVLVSQGPISELDIKITQQSHEMPTRHNFDIGQEYALDLPYLQKVSSEFEYKVFGKAKQIHLDLQSKMKVAQFT